MKRPNKKWLKLRRKGYWVATRWDYDDWVFSTPNLGGLGDGFMSKRDAILGAIKYDRIKYA